MNKTEDHSKARNTALLGWIVAAIFGALLLLVTGMFLMYVWMSNGATGPDSAKGTADFRNANQSNNGIGDSSDNANAAANSKRPSLPALPALSKMQANLLSDANLKYAFNWDEEQLAYKFDFKINVPNDPMRITGRTTLKPSSKDPKQLLSEEEPKESTGTGFVIHPDGLILTCAHVVEGANKIDITLDGKSYRGVVVAMDATNDLALVRVQVNNADYLSIAKPVSVDQGQAVRVFGYPLTDLLGSSLKISSGSITGFSDGTQEVQLDATVNPGNSGGPVVNQQGWVVGVASALLDAEGISSVGLAVGVQQVAGFLGRCKVPFAKEAAPLTVADIKQCVVFIHSSGQKLDQSKSKALDYVSHYSQVYDASDLRGGFSMLRQSTISDNDRGAIVLDQRGVLGNRRHKQKSLPLFFRKLCLIGIEQLPQVGGRNSWSENESFVIERTRKENDARLSHPFAGLHGRNFMRHPLFPSSSVTEKTVAIIVSQTENFKIKSDNDQEMVIEKAFKLETIQSPDESFNVDIQYSGNYVFDKTTRQIKRGKYSGEALLPLNNKLTRLPIELSFKKVSKKELEQEHQRKIAQKKKADERKTRRDSITVPALDQYDPSK